MKDLGHNILKCFNILPNISFSMRKMGSDISNKSGVCALPHKFSND